MTSKTQIEQKTKYQTLEEEWFKELIFRGDLKSFNRYVKAECLAWDGKPGPVIKKKYLLYTPSHSYSIVANVDDKTGYLGCVASNRTPVAGEDWTRGRDLPDGPFTKKTWDKIVRAIVAYELEPISDLFVTTSGEDGLQTMRKTTEAQNLDGGTPPELPGEEK